MQLPAGGPSASSPAAAAEGGQATLNAAAGSAAASAAADSAAAAAKAAHLADQGAELAAEGEFAAAAAVFERALQLDGSAAAVHEMLAQCRMEEGQDEAAYAAASAAVSLQRDWPDALATLGRTARNTGRLREAAAAFGRYLELAAAGGGGGRAGAGAADSPQQQQQQPLPPQQQQEGANEPALNSLQGAAVPAAVRAGEEEDEAAAVCEELAEVQQLLQLQLGHQLGLPGLRLLESHGAAAGPGAVAWEAGALLAWFLVQQGQAAGGTSCCTDSLGPRGCGAHCSSGSSGGGGACMQACDIAAGMPAAAAEAAMQPPSRPAQPWLCGSRVLELGSGGTGLVGLAAASLGADVTATDLPAMLPQLEAAIAANASLVAAAGGGIRAAPLDWRVGSALLAPAGGPKAQYSWLLGADLVYSLEPVAALVATVAAAAAHVQAHGGEPLRWAAAGCSWVPGIAGCSESERCSMYDEGAVVRLAISAAKVPQSRIWSPSLAGSSSHTSTGTRLWIKHCWTGWRQRVCDSQQC